MGGSSPNNATSPSGLLEKNLTLAVARHAAASLTALGHTVRLTRTSDVNLALVDRAEVAREAQADAFVSIHFNGFADPTAQGTETWVHLSSSSRSHDLAECVQRSVLRATGYLNRGVQSKVLGVLDASHHAAHTAACLAELSFITTTAEDKRLQDAAYLQTLGEAVANGVQAFVTRPVAAPAPPSAAAVAVESVRRERSILGLDGRPDPIEHVVVLMLENRSFDHMLGGLKAKITDVDGVDPSAPGVNRDLTDDNRRYTQRPTTTTALAQDPKHELSNTLAQLTVDGDNGGFVTDFRLAYRADPTVTQEVMGYYEFGKLPVLHALASQFMTCDRWFSSVPGPTWTNRLFVHSGTSLGRVSMPQSPMDLNLHLYSQDTIYDRLNDAGVPWRIYYGDAPQSLILTHQLLPRNAGKYRQMRSFVDDARGPAEKFPAYAFIEPNYFVNQNDQHPPSDVMRGEALLARVYNALRANEALWAKTLLVVLYDEHGGFYDHVPPPKAVPPDEHQEEYTFDRYGVRVPAVLVSPWLPAQVLHTVFDHTSLLKYLCDKWRLSPLGARQVNANSFASAFLPAMRHDTPERLREPMVPEVAASLAMPEVEPPLNEFQRGLVAMSEMLETYLHEEGAVVAARRMRSLDGPAASAGTALDRIERFLQRQREHGYSLREVVEPPRPIGGARQRLDAGHAAKRAVGAILRVADGVSAELPPVTLEATVAAVPAPAGPVTVNATNPILTDVRAAFNRLPKKGSKAKYAGKVKRDADGETHLQGLAAYKEFFLLTHSDKSQASGRILLVDRRPAQKKLVGEFRLPALHADGPPLNHAGGCQLIGDVLAVPCESGSNSSVVAFFDVSDPLNIRELHQSLRIPRNDRDAAAAGITTVDRNGQRSWLCAVYDSGSVDVYESFDLPGGSPFQPVLPAPLKVKEKDHQALLLFTDTTNRVFAAGLNRGNFPFFDRVVLYEIDLGGQTMKADPERSYSTSGGARLRWGAGLEFVGSDLALYCSERNYDSGCDIASFVRSQAADVLAGRGLEVVPRRRGMRKAVTPRVAGKRAGAKRSTTRRRKGR